MPQANVTVEFVNPPKEGFSSGSIKAKFPDGKSYYVDVNEEQLRDFAKGGTYCIFWLDKTRRTSGKAYRQFQEFVSKPADPPRQAPATAPQKVVQRAHYEDPTQASPRTNFVSNVVGSAMHSGMFKPDDILELTVAAHRAWGHAFLGEGEVIPKYYRVEAPTQPPISGAGTKAMPVTPGNIPERDFARADGPLDDEPPPWADEEIPR